MGLFDELNRRGSWANRPEERVDFETQPAMVEADYAVDNAPDDTVDNDSSAAKDAKDKRSNREKFEARMKARAEKKAEKAKQKEIKRLEKEVEKLGEDRKQVAEITQNKMNLPQGPIGGSSVGYRSSSTLLDGEGVGEVAREINEQYGLETYASAVADELM
jgi:type II secretory pathway component HofQ